MRPRAHLLGRWLEPLAAGLWTLFVLVSVLVGAVWALGIGDAALERWISARDLRVALTWLLRRLDLLWITLAAANAYLALAEREGLPAARRWGLIILVSVVALAWMSARTGFPFGPVVYGEPLGLKLGAVPMGLPFLWFTVILGAREALLHFLPRLSHAATAAGVGVLGALTDANLEPLAAKLRGLWFWRASLPGEPPVFDPPLHGCLVWGAVAGLLAFALRERSVVASARRSWKPAVTLAIFHAVFLAAHLGRAWRG